MSESEAGSALKTLRELLDLFVKHVQEPIGAVSAAAEELVPTAGVESTPRCPTVPGPVVPGAADSEYVERLMRIVEVLRFFAKARKDRRAGDQAELSGRLLLSMGPALLDGEQAPKTLNTARPKEEQDKPLALGDEQFPRPLNSTIEDTVGSGLVSWVSGLLGSDQSSKPLDSNMACQNGQPEASQRSRPLQLGPTSSERIPTPLSPLDATIEVVTDPQLTGWMAGWQPGARSSRNAK